MGSVGGVVQYLASFALVVALLVGLLWSLKRLQGSAAFTRREQRLQVLESLSVGARMKVALVRCDDRELLVGVTPTQITPLGTWRSLEAQAKADAAAARATPKVLTQWPPQQES